MNQGLLDRGRFETIEAYVLGTLPAGERARFEQEIAANAALRAEVELQRENTLAVELGGVERMLHEVGAEQSADDQRVAGSGWTMYLKYAAVVAVLLAGAGWWFGRTSPHEHLFAEYYAADPGLPVAMSASGDHAFQDAMVAYKLGEYSEARIKWGALLRTEPDNDTLRYYVASASLADGDALAAIPLFDGLTNDPASTFHDRSQWFLFLAHLKAGEVEKAKAMAFDDDPTYGERVRAIKAELK